MPDPTTVLLIVAAATFLLPIIFLVVVVYAVGRRGRGIAIGPRLTSLVTVLGGMSIGVFLITGADDLLVAGPILGAAVLLVVMLWRRRRRVQAGQLLLGTAIPWTVLWTLYLFGSLVEPTKFDLQAVITWFTVGAVGVGAGVFLIRRGDPAAPAPSPTAGVGEPGSRAFGSVAAAIRESARVGPFGISELAALVGFVLAWTLVPLLLLPAGLPPVATALIAIVVAAALATEGYIRAMPSRSRRAFEAFSWLGEWELRGAGASFIDPIPTSEGEAVEWLAHHPEEPDKLALRAEILLLAKRFDEAKAIAERLSALTPADRWVRATTLESVDWRSGGDGDLSGLEAAAAELTPADGDEHLRADVEIAIAQVRRRMADGRTTAGDALEPLIAVRSRLGHRADGQVGRALRRRLFATTLVVGLVFSAILWVVVPGSGPSL